ncbi:hypothetical protein BDA96_08G043000 [Sorghum bicolor]|uniref:Uncharacterized protein n=1 Tax=Sorghum bicolor TaxID=4558 RepID=A0A921QGN3_SORBI|nr:hypothetical protein BDA96_08G043000 [Sorghum bicolor]
MAGRRQPRAPAHAGRTRRGGNGVAAARKLRSRAGTAACRPEHSRWSISIGGGLCSILAVRPFRRTVRTAAVSRRPRTYDVVCTNRSASSSSSSSSAKNSMASASRILYRTW